ncbi:hypothetical protein I545_2649 [Mycobacterium kansasii 662]|uniref:Uncharacterized protein n=2 Tax=Mycobacterium kansasii TaxID=1768 RepID=A0A1V3WMF1_MYCKA|nr:hypothetical protein I545_2649 [Mycobacterium kansasii 662]OOK68115.1 hypothetical protein BZL29_6974 [Mycobacterium kansasii]
MVWLRFWRYMTQGWTFVIDDFRRRFRVVMPGRKALAAPPATAAAE